MSKQYAGIDYGHGQSNINKETGIRFGVISCNTIMPEACDDFEPDYGRPEELECPECDHCFHPIVEGKDPLEWGGEARCPECGEEFTAELPDCVESNGWTYEKEGYALSSCLDNDAMILKSPYYTYAQLCSPCVPGAGNLDNPFEPFEGSIASLKAAAILHRRQAEKAGFVKTYCLGWDWFDEYNPCPYTFIYSAETNEPVLA